MVNRPSATTQESSLLKRSSSSLFLNKPGIPSLQACRLRAPIPVALCRRGSAPGKPSLVKSEWQRKDPCQKKSHFLEMLFPTFASLFLCVVFFHIVSRHFIGAAYYIRISYYFFILFNFKTIKTICHLVNTNIFSFLDQSVSCLCCNGSLTLFFFTRQAGDTLIRCQTVSLQQTGNTELEMIRCYYAPWWFHDMSAIMLKNPPYITYNIQNISVKFQFF